MNEYIKNEGLIVCSDFWNSILDVKRVISDKEADEMYREINNLREEGF